MEIDGSQKLPYCNHCHHCSYCCTHHYCCHRGKRLCSLYHKCTKCDRCHKTYQELYHSSKVGNRTISRGYESKYEDYIIEFIDEKPENIENGWTLCDECIDDLVRSNICKISIDFI